MAKKTSLGGEVFMFSCVNHYNGIIIYNIYFAELIFFNVLNFYECLYDI